jgi:hydroxymethylpyrimidine pyrophosphatase-like HAD family hydrolase
VHDLAHPGGPGPPEVIATDLDGTLLRGDGTLGALTREVLAECQAAGALLVICTARPVRWMRPLAAEIGGGPLAACDNGAVLWDLTADRLLGATALSPGDARLVVAAIDRSLPGGAWAVERIDGFGHEPGYRPHWPPPSGSAVAPAIELVSEPVVKLMFRHQRHTADARRARAQAAAGDRAEVTHSNSAGDLLEISAVGVSKATALAALCARRGVAAERVVAFGDMPNDLSMLRWAGHAVAVAGSHPDVLDVADEIAPGNDEDGVARVLARIWALPVRASR